MSHCYIITDYDHCCKPTPCPFPPLCLDEPIIKASNYVDIKVGAGAKKKVCVIFQGPKFPNDRVTLSISTFNEFKILNGEKIEGPFNELTAFASNVNRKGFCVNFENASNTSITVSFSWSAIQHTQ